MLIGITAPAYISNQSLSSFLTQLTKSIKTEHQFIFVLVENFISFPYTLEFTQQPQEIIKLKPNGQQGVAKGWNMGINKCIEKGCDYILVANIDIMLRSTAIDEFVKFGEENSDVILWSAQRTTDVNFETVSIDTNVQGYPTYSCYMVRKSFMQETNGFDENFAVYGYDDCDMDTRINISGKKSCIAGKAIFFDRISQTVKQDKHYENNVLNPQFIKNKEYFIRKWGRDTTSDISLLYKHPFNDNNLDVHYWKV